MDICNSEKRLETYLHSRVCEKHSPAEAIITKKSSFDAKSGKMILTSLERPRLKKDSVPSIFPGCPDYYSTSVTLRVLPDKKRQRMESLNIDNAITKSLMEHSQYLTKNKINSFSELCDKVKELKLSKFWNVVCQDNDILFFNLSHDVPTEIVYLLVVNKELELKLFLKVFAYNLLMILSLR
ncbi:hypothetical protein HELRODRAFT_177466 [Helobdella robusta]|uniref:Uncharacterized protein n=1 Tax=Helobdella robusta TaxID=6412 RepID=T1FBQ8_HELRO|nr:hypothetical protein HELRODRAFT_177466 [Helobdella robusta]ESN97830.1 hypothetical protein HELRODRAFT_177466 [Helobdella robusta]